MANSLGPARTLTSCKCPAEAKAEAMHDLRPPERAFCRQGQELQGASFNAPANKLWVSRAPGEKTGLGGAPRCLLCRKNGTESQM